RAKRLETARRMLSTRRRGSSRVPVSQVGAPFVAIAGAVSALAKQVLQYALFRQGMLAMTGAPIRAFVCSREGQEGPDLMPGWIPVLTEPSPNGPRISWQSGLTLYAHPMRPESKGHVHTTAADARRPPAINFNFLSTPPDAELTVRAVRIARE